MKSETSVVNIRVRPCTRYIGREVGRFPASQWGNPYHVGPDGTRAEVIEKYRRLIVRRLRRKVWRDRLLKLDGHILGCWCAPKPCHGDVLVELIEEVKAGKYG